MPAPVTPAKRAAFGALSGLVCALLARPSAAQGAPPAPGPESALGPIHLAWTAPSVCPTAESVTGRIHRLLGGPPKAADHSLAAAASVEAIPRGFRLEITLTTGDLSSKRILQGAECDAVADAAALVIALAFDPEAVAAAEAKEASSNDSASPGHNGAPGNSGAPGNDGAPGNTASPGVGGSPENTPPGGDLGAPPPPPPPGQVVRIPVILPPPRATSGPPSGAPWTFGLFAQAAGDAGSLPGVVPGVRAGVSLGIGAYRVEPSFEAWPSAKSTLPDRPTTGANLRLLAFSLSACRRVYPWTVASETASWGFFGCLGFEVGEIRGEGFGVTTPRSASALWTAPKAHVRAEIPLYRGLALSIEGGLAIPLDRRTFTLTLTSTRTALHEPGAVSARFGGGLSYRF